MAASFLRPSRLDPQDHGYVKSRFSRHGRPVQVLASWLLDVREMRNIERLIVQGTDETVMAFKGSQIGAVGMTAVASAIVAQLSSTTLQIHALSNVNWTASAFIIAALLSSILATMLSCIQQQVLGTLNESDGVRIWLSNGSARRTRSKDSGDALTGGRGRDELQTSVASLLLLRLPNAFLLYSVASFLVGFGLFLGFAWRRDLDSTPSRDSNFAVMIMYVVVGAVTFLGTGGVVKWKMAEVDQAERIFGKDIEGGDDGGDGSGNGSQHDDSGSEGEDDRLLGKGRKSKKYSSTEGVDHERIAKALEDAARAHKELARLMRNADGDRNRPMRPRT